MVGPQGHTRQDYINRAQQIADTLRGPGALPDQRRATIIAEGSLYVELAKLMPEEPTP